MFILALTNLLYNFLCTVPVILLFRRTFISIGGIFDADCKFVFTKQSVVVYDPQQQPIIIGWREHTGAKLWHIALRPSPTNIPTLPSTATRSSLQEFSAYNLPSVESLIRYFHTAAGFPVQDTWLRGIIYGNYSSWPGLTYSNTVKFYPS